MSGGGGSDEAIAFQNKQIDKAYQYDAMMWHYHNNPSSPTVAEGGVVTATHDGKPRSYESLGLPPGSRGVAWRQYDEALARQDFAKLNAERSKAFQTEERRRAWEFDKTRREHEFGVQTDIRDYQQGFITKQKDLNLTEFDLASAREQEVLTEALAQAAFENKEVIKDFDFDTFSLGFKKEELMNQLGLSNSQSDTQSKQSSADLATQQRLNAAAQGRSIIELEQREKELNTAASLSHHEANTAVAKALNESQAVTQQAALAEDKLQTEAQKAQTVLSQRTGDAAFQRAEAELRIEAKRGDVAATKQGLTEDYFVKDAANRFNRAALGIDTEQIKQTKDYQNDLIGRDIQSQTAKAKFSAQQAHLEALKQSGQAAVLQAGRSQGKNIVAYLSLVGQQQAELVDSLVRAETVGQRKQRQNRVQALNDVQRAAIRGQQIDLSSLENLNKLSLGISEADRSLALAETQTGLDLGKIGKSVQDATQLTDITVKELQREVTARKGLTATSLEDLQNSITAKRREEELKYEGFVDEKEGARRLTNNRISSLLAEIEGRQAQDQILQEGIASRKAYEYAGYDISSRSADSELQRLVATKGLNQEIIAASEASARRAKEMNIGDITQARNQADLIADAKLMPPPTMAPGMQSPQPLQDVAWQPIPTPVPTPAPLHGAKMSQPTMGAVDYLGSAGMGAVAGVSTYAAVNSVAAIAPAAPYLAVAVGLYTMFSSWF